MVFERLRATLELDTSGFKSGIEDAQSSMDDLGSQVQSTGKNMQRIGGRMTAGLSAPLGAMAGMSAQAAGNFDAAMQESIAVMGDVDESMRENLEQTARDVAKTMSVSHEEAASSFYYLASAGLDAQESMESMPDVAAFAEAGQMDMAEATDVATNVMSAFGYQADEMTEVTDTMTATVSNHNQTMQGMSSAMSQVAPVASSLGVSIGETSAAIGMLGDVGIQGEKAGTAMRNIFSQLSDETSTASETLADMGVKVRDSEGNMLDFVTILENMQDAGVEAADATRIFGREAGPAMAALLEEGGDALRENTQNIEDMEGATEEVAETQRDTFNAELDILKSNIRDVGITIGEILLPVLNSLVENLMPVAEWFQNLTGRQQKFIVVVGALVAALGPLLAVVGTILTMLPAMASGFALLTAVTLPVSAPILAIAAAIGVLAAVVATDFLGIRSMIVGAVGDMILAFSRLTEFIVEGIASAMVKAAVAIANKASDIKQAVDDLVTDAIEKLLGYWSDFKSAGKGLIDALVEGIKSAPGEVKDAVEDAVGGARDLLPFSPAKEGPLSDLDESGKALPETVASGIRSNANAVEPATERMAERAQPQLSANPPRADQANNARSGATVQIDFGSLDNDDYVSVGALKQMIKDELDRDAKLARTTTPGAR